MPGPGQLARVGGAVLLIGGALGAASLPASAQRDEGRGERAREGQREQAREGRRQQAREGRGVRRPTKLLEEYPFGQERLRARERSERRAAGAAGTAESTRAPADAGSARVATDSAADSDDSSWLTIALVLASVMALLVLGAVGRRFVWASRGRRRPATEPSAPAPESDAPPARAPAVEPDLPPAQATPRGRHFQRRRATPPPPVHKARNTYAVANQKGGVGKTTVSLVLGAAANRHGSSVLLVDLDPQASATMVLGARDERPTVGDVMREPAACSLVDTIVSTEWGLDLAPSERALRHAEAGLADQGVLSGQLDAVADYDLVLIDCPPNLGALTIDALTAASWALVVTEPTFLAVHALEELLETLDHVASERNPALELAGVVLNRVEATAEHKRSLADLEATLASRIWEPRIPKRAVLQDAMRQGVPPQDLRSHYAEEITGLFDELAGRLELSGARL